MEKEVVEEVRAKGAEPVGDKVDRGKAAAWAVPLLLALVATVSARNADTRNLTREESHACNRNVQNAGYR